MLLNISQLRVLSEFFSNMAVIWFAAAFVAPASPNYTLRAAFSGFLSILLALFLLKEVEV